MTIDEERFARLNAILNSPPVTWSEQYKNKNKDNKRVHIKLYKSLLGNYARTKYWGDKSMVEKTLDDLWKSFGSVTDTHYERDFGYCFVSFSTHEEAEAALETINSNESVVEAAKALIQGLKGEARTKADQIISFLVLKEEFSAVKKRASWARPRRNSTCRRSSGFEAWQREFDFSGSVHDYDLGGTYYDSIPDGFTEAEWDAYCDR